MKNTVSNINIINTILEALDRSEEDIRRPRLRQHRLRGGEYPLRCGQVPQE